MNKVALLILSIAISAFMLGGTTLLFLDKRYIRADEPQKVMGSPSGSVRLENGTQICWGPLQVSHLPDQQNADLRKVTATYPVPFVEKPVVTLGIHPVFTIGAGVAWAFYDPISNTPTGYSGQIFAFSSPPITKADFAIKEVEVDYIAIGKWK